MLEHAVSPGGAAEHGDRAGVAARRRERGGQRPERRDEPVAGHEHSQPA